MASEEPLQSSSQGISAGSGVHRATDGFLLQGDCPQEQGPVFAASISQYEWGLAHLLPVRHYMQHVEQFSGVLTM